MSARRRSLGRGLDSLIKVPAAQGATARLVDIHPNEDQPRKQFDESALGELAESISAQGVVQPIVVTPRPAGGYTIVAGERRWRAAQRAGLDTVPIFVRDVGGDQEMLELALVENIQRSDLDPLEEARAYAMLAGEFGMTQGQIASRVGKSRPTVANALRLLKLPPPVHELISAGRLTAGQARPLLRLDSADDQVALARRAADDRLTARQVETAARPSPARSVGGEAKTKAPDPNTAAATEALTKALQTRVEIARRGQGGQIRIHFHSEEELMGLFDRLTKGRAS